MFGIVDPEFDDFELPDLEKIRRFGLFVDFSAPSGRGETDSAWLSKNYGVNKRNVILSLRYWLDRHGG